MKILHVFPFFSIRFAGGTSDLMFKIAEAQKKAGLSPAILSGDYRFDQDLADELKGVSFNVFKSYADRAGFSIMPGLKRWARRGLSEFDVVHFHVFRTFQNLVLWKECRRQGIPYVIDAHGSVPYAERKRGLKRLFDRVWGREMLLKAGSVIGETQVGIDEYLAVESKIPEERLAVLSPPFDVEPFIELPPRGPFRNEFGIAAEAPMICFLGRIHPIKGNDFLMRGFAEFAKQRTDAKLVFIGPDDGHQAELEILSQTLGVEDKIVWAGFRSGDDKIQALVDSDVVAQMSRQEQGAWAPFEGILCRVPIIVTGHTGAGEDVKRLNAGETVELDNVPELAGCLEKLISEREPSMANTLRVRQVIIEELSFRSRVHEYTALYAAAVERLG